MEDRSPRAKLKQLVFSETERHAHKNRKDLAVQMTLHWSSAFWTLLSFTMEAGDQARASKREEDQRGQGSWPSQ